MGIDRLHPAEKIDDLRAVRYHSATIFIPSGEGKGVGYAGRC